MENVVSLFQGQNGAFSGQGTVCAPAEACSSMLFAPLRQPKVGFYTSSRRNGMVAPRMFQS